MTDLLFPLTIFVLAILVGFEAIAKVPATLHTPLMSGANSIHGIVLVGGMIIAANAKDPLGYLLAFVAMAFGAMNVVGGYVVTDRMLLMFRKKPSAPLPGTKS
jgi:NAD(P) transhydrogenase subunit alpha